MTRIKALLALSLVLLLRPAAAADAAAEAEAGGHGSPPFTLGRPRRSVDAAADHTSRSAVTFDASTPETPAETDCGTGASAGGTAFTDGTGASTGGHGSPLGRRGSPCRTVRA